MATKQLLTAVLAGGLSLCPVAQVAAQGDGGGPLKQRIQSRVEAQAGQKKAEAQAQIESRMAAAIPNPEQIAQASQVRQVQTALNFFGFDAGPVDGVMGNKSRSAIQAYQIYLGYPVTGQLTDSEGQFLVRSYQKAQEDPATTRQVAAAHPDGIKGLLLVYRDAMTKKDTAQVGVMPNFSVPAAQASLADRCGKLAEARLPGGAAPDLASRDTAKLLLGMAFCQARDAVIAESRAAAARAQGFTPGEIAQQCIGFAPALTSLVALLPETPPDEVASAAAAFIGRSGQAPDQMAGIAMTCLGVAYDADRMDLAIGSAQILVGLGDAAYGEFQGHHLSLGVGTAARPDLALSWYETALTTGDGTQVWADAPDRAARIVAAAGVLSAPETATAAPVPSFSVPKAGD